MSYYYVIKGADGAPIKMQHFKFKIIASICMGHSAYEVLYQMNKSMEASVNNEDTYFCGNCSSDVSKHSVIGIENISNRCRSIVVRKVIMANTCMTPPPMPKIL